MPRSPNSVLAVRIMGASLLALTAFLLVVTMPAEAEIRVLRLENGTVNVRYELPGDLSELRFYVDSSTIRNDYWHIETDTLELRSDKILSPTGSMFSHAAVTLIPNERPVDRVFPSLISFNNAASLVNIDYIRAKNGLTDMPITVQNAYDPYEQRCVANYSLKPDKRRNLPDTAGRYVFLGTRIEDCVAAFKSTVPGVVVSDEASDALADFISDAFLPIYNQLLQSLDLPVSPKPTVFVSHERASTFNSFQADVGWNSIISLRFFGSSWDELDPASSVQILNVLAHEIVHLWIGTTFVIPGQPGQAWLHEGAAEYIALRELLRRDWISDEYFRNRIERYLNGCSRSLGAMSLMTERAPQGGRLVYDCGVLIQFVYDAVIHYETDGQKSVVEVWRELMSASLEAGTFAVTAEEFVASDTRAQNILGSVLHGPHMDTPALLDALQEFGVDATLEEDTAVGPIMMTLLMPFFEKDCETGPWGFFTLEDHLSLDVNDSCRSIPAGFVLRQIQNLDVLKNPGRAFEAVSEVCARGGEIQMSGRRPEEPELTLQCPKQMPVRPVRIVIRELPSL